MYYYLGNHQKIREYREKESLKITLERRPDLIKNKNIKKEALNGQN